MVESMGACKACGQPVAKGVKKCPHCGKDQRSWPARHKFLTALAALVLLGAIIGIVGGGGGDDAAGNGPVAQEPAEPPMPVTATQMVADVESNALKAEQTYADKRLEVTGKFSSVDAQGGYFSVQGDQDFSLTTIRADIQEEHKAQVAEFTEGQEVTFIGTVTDVGEILGYAIDVESIS